MTRNKIVSMDETQSAAATLYRCFMCNQRVEPVIELNTVKCPLCQNGFVEEMDPSISALGVHHQIPDDYLSGGGGEMGPDLDDNSSLWAPVLLGMMSNPRRRRRSRRRLELEYEDNDDILSGVDEVETELDHQLQSYIHTRRRNSATILQLLQGVRSGSISESTNSSENENGGSERDATERRERDHVILINSSNRTIILQGGNFRNRNQNPSGSLGDYFVGPSLDLLLQHLAENDPNGYGTPPAKKEPVEAMPTVKIKENVQCSVCLDDLEMGTEAKEIPCKHKFHSGCIFPWLKLHSSCPVCRYQLPSDGSKFDSDQPTSNNNRDTNIDNNNNINSYRNDDSSTRSSGSGLNNVDSGNGDGIIVEETNARSENRRGFSVPLPWRFSDMFSSSGNRGSSSSSVSDATRIASPTDEN